MVTRGYIGHNVHDEAESSTKSCIGHRRRGTSPRYSGVLVADALLQHPNSDRSTPTPTAPAPRTPSRRTWAATRTRSRRSRAATRNRPARTGTHSPHTLVAPPQLQHPNSDRSTPTPTAPAPRTPSRRTRAATRTRSRRTRAATRNRPARTGTHSPHTLVAPPQLQHPNSDRSTPTATAPTRYTAPPTSRAASSA